MPPFHRCKIRETWHHPGQLGHDADKKELEMPNDEMISALPLTPAEGMRMLAAM